MSKYLIEVPHEEETVACARAIKILLESGSHFLTHADFGCRDGVHKGWIVVEADSKTEARNMLHPYFRNFATIIGLNKFSVEELDDLITHHREYRDHRDHGSEKAGPKSRGGDRHFVEVL